MPATLLRAIGSILIVDDDKALLASLKRRFEAKEWTAFAAMRGLEAVETRPPTQADGDRARTFSSRTSTGWI